ncbi:hypothetical protein DI270_000525 [Microbispora triticiradicis]|uniref:Uncharacterized protein n=1 Tax=Microbispora triticiradicis TaxID=2200763 RepID=A0ABX9LSM0_9ACTN|nr:hypothetical protein [Microbispora triticiradicis]RGA06982.1 hypothetical protein DI270_000525 [Microbispora triticiradicis]GLW22926.1 hypothetical protein Mame01_29690 [Microbispora amethystogenes]
MTHTHVLGFNPLPSPVTLGDGQVVGGLDWEAVDSADPAVAELLASGRLVLVPDPQSADGLDERAAAAWERVLAVRADTTPARRGGRRTENGA